MNDYSAPRRFRAQPDRGEISAQSMPELLHGECVMQRRLHLALNAADQRTVTVWSRTVLAVCGVIAALTIAIPLALQRDDVRPQARANAEAHAAICAGWDHAAGGAIATLVRGDRDADLRRTSDAVFYMRRARRNCEAGWVNLACGDYHAILRMAKGDAVIIDRSAAIPRCQSIEDRSRMVEMPAN
jgi:hypothetical protein